MKKIMFNDEFMLTKAVLEGKKTQTRRICKEQIWAHSDIVNAENGIFHFEIPKYKVGEVVAVAQSYKTLFEEERAYASRFFNLRNSAGWNNKMFVKAELMYRRIKILDVRFEMLQDISDEDCLKEGIKKFDAFGEPASYIFCDSKNKIFPKGWCTSPRKAYAELIDRVSGKGTWESNPYVFVYDFELLK